MLDFAAGDNAAFHELFQRYKDRLFRFIVGAYAFNRHMAEDCLQETFVRVIRYRNRFDAGRTFSTWLYTIARNHCVNELRRKQRRCEVSSPETVLQSLTAEKDSRQRMLADEAASAMRQAVWDLPEHLRSVFMMREMNGFSHSEIAEVLGLSAGNVRIQYHRAKKKLREQLRPYLEDE